MVVAVFGTRTHTEAPDAVIAAAETSGAEQLWSLGDMVGRGPDPEHVVTRTRERCAVALMGNHDYGATAWPSRRGLGEPGSPAVRSIEHACERLSDAEVEWMRTRAAARRGDVQCWHGGPRNAVHEYVGASNAADCLAVQRAEVGSSDTAMPRLRGGTRRRARARPGSVSAYLLDLAGGKYADLERPARRNRRGSLVDALDAQAAEGAWWLTLDLDRRMATWHRAPYDPAPARLRARAPGLDDASVFSRARDS